MAVTQNFENEASMKTGRTGGLPYVGIGWCRTVFRVPHGRRAVLLFDGAMSEARVYVNGEQVCFWPYGYSSFWCDVTDAMSQMSLLMETMSWQSDWRTCRSLPAGIRGQGCTGMCILSRPGDVHIPVWGTRVTTPDVDSLSASVRIETKVENADGQSLLVCTDIISPDGEVVSSRRDVRTVNHGQPVIQNFTVEDPLLWSPESPDLYRAVTGIYICAENGAFPPVLADTFETVFGCLRILLRLCSASGLWSS